MAFDKTLFNLKGNNVSPTSSTLYARFEDVDCSSATNFTKAPVAGQFIVAPGKTGMAKGADTLYLGTTAQVDDGIPVGNLSVAMAWPSNFRTDMDALGNSKVPVVRGAVRFKTKIFNCDSGTTLALAGYVPGAQLTVQKTFTSIGSDTIGDRLVLQAIPAASSAPEASTAVVVGYVTRVITDSVVSGTGEIEVQLYEFPRVVSKGAA